MKPRKKERKKNRESRKSAGRHGELTNSEQDTHLERKRKKKRKKISGSGTMKFQS
jgi:hypothetical protein